MALSELVRITPSKRLVARAKNWLRKFPHDGEAPGVLGSILKVESPAEHLDLARLHLTEAEEKYFKPGLGAYELSRLMVTVLERYAHTDLFEIIADYVERYPHNFVWNLVFPVRLPGKPDRRLEMLTARWIRLNATNDEAYVAAAVSVTPCREVFEATLEYVRKSGPDYVDMPYALIEILREAHAYEALMPMVVKEAQGWVQRNQDDAGAGKVLARLVLLTGARADAEQAKSWYKRHRRNESSWEVLVALLKQAKEAGTTPDPYVVRQAEAMLKDDEALTRSRALAGELMAVLPDTGERAA